MVKKLILFDLDWTLLYTGGAGVRALDYAFEKQFGIASAMKSMSVDGKTDRSIAREMVSVHLKRDATPDEIELICRGYIERLRFEVETGAGYRIMPGIPQLLQALQKEPSIVMGLGTGNLRAGAQIKLEKAKMWDYFGFGGFADDSEDRPTLLAMGAKRGFEKLGKTLAPRDVIVIGDNKRDVLSGQAIGATTIAVATGSMSLEELGQHRPDFLFQDLSDTSKVLEALRS